MIRILPTFYRDHYERGLDTPVNHSRFKSYVLIDPADPALPELIADARYYVENMADPGWSSATGMARSAAAMLRAIQSEGNTLRPVNTVCTCGHDVVDHGRGEQRLISGCRECGCDYWHEKRT
jgi:hypothetical protein